MFRKIVIGGGLEQMGNLEHVTHGYLQRTTWED